VPSNTRKKVLRHTPPTLLISPLLALTSALTAALGLTAVWECTGVDLIRRSHTHVENSPKVEVAIVHKSLSIPCVAWIR
jgi:hypothetical protein